MRTLCLPCPRKTNRPLVRNQKRLGLAKLKRTFAQTIRIILRLPHMKMWGFEAKRARKFTRTSPRRLPWNFIAMLSAPPIFRPFRSKCCQFRSKIEMSAGSIHHVMWSFLAKMWPKNAKNYHITWCPWAFKASTFSITWCDPFWPNLRFEIAEGFRIRWRMLAA